MERVFLDSSALVKNFVEEPGSRRVEDLLSRQPSHNIHIAPVTVVEVVSALKRRERNGSLSEEEAASAGDEAVRFWRQDCVVWDLDDSLIERAVAVARRYALRGYDCIQLACAIDLRDTARARGDTIVLWGSDRELLLAAHAEGITTINPQETQSGTRGPAPSPTNAEPNQ